LGPEQLDFIDSGPDVVHFARPGGWHCVTNVGRASVPLPGGEVLLTSSRPGAGDPGVDDGTLPGETTAWIRVP
ncbi:MAG: DUF3459 domain-containing protein, partial [Marmoricola sp.]